MRTALMFWRNVLPIAGIASGLMITVVWAAFLGFEFFRAVEFLL
jgi:hypothetical protein